MWDLSAPQPVMETSPPILEGEVLTTESPGKSPRSVFNQKCH